MNVEPKDGSNPPATRLARSLSALSRWNRRRLAIRDLRRLDPRLLADVGVERGQIAEIVDAMLAARADAVPASRPEPALVPAPAIASTSGAA